MANIIVATIELTVANSDVAALEWAVRVNKELSPAEIGRRAVAIRDINALRVAAKVQLGKYLGEKVDGKHECPRHDTGKHHPTALAKERLLGGVDRSWGHGGLFEGAHGSVRKN